jgi:hypothetical protein
MLFLAALWEREYKLVLYSPKVNNNGLVIIIAEPSLSTSLLY